MVVTGVAPSATVPLCFLMSDVGTDWWGAGAWLLQTKTDTDGLTDKDRGGLIWGAECRGLDAASAALSADGWPEPLHLLRAPREGWQAGAAATPAESHSALFSMHVALLSAWQALGVLPDAVMSFSMGEPSGAVASGALSAAAGAAVMSAMTRCVSAAAGAGGMLAVIGLRPDDLAAQAVMQEGVEVGAVFARAGGALTGSFAGLAAVEARLKTDDRIKVLVRPPVIKAPYHSAAFEPMQQVFCDEVAAALQAATDVSDSDSSSSPRVLPWFTSIDGGRTADPAASARSPEFWYTGLRAPALSQRATEAALDAGFRIFIEMNGSPFYCVHPVGDEMAERGLLGPSPAPDESGEEVCGLALCTIRQDVSQVSAEAQMLGALCRVWVAGARVDWGKLSATVAAVAREEDKDQSSVL